MLGTVWAAPELKIDIPNTMGAHLCDGILTICTQDKM